MNIKVATLYRMLAAPMAMLGMACSPAATPEESAQAAPAPLVQGVHPESGLQIIDVTIISGEKRHVFAAEYAESREAQLRGLMFRTEMADNAAMLFPMKTPQPASFWMRNTPISLDIAFVGIDGRITNIAENTTPYSLESIPSEGLASAVLEMRGGRAKELGIAPGDLVEWNPPAVQSNAGEEPAN